MALNVIKISKVSSATDSVDPLVLPLTFFDFLWLKLNPDLSRDFFYSVILPKLERSLSLVLTHFRPLCGQLKWSPQDPKPYVVVLSSDALSFTVAETDADFSRLSNKGLRPEVELRPLVPELLVSPDLASIFAVQITLFPQHGYSMGTSAHHVVIDGKTAARFHKSWAHMCKHGTMPQDLHLPMVLDRSVFNVPDGLEQKIFQLLPYLSEDKDSARTLKPPPLKKIDNHVRITLELTQENVEKLKERAKNESSRSDIHMSTFVVTYAYVLTCLVKARGGDLHRPVRFMYAVDCRNRLDPPVPIRYLGNCVLPIDLYGYEARTLLEEDGFVNGVEILSDSIKGLGSQGAESIWEVYEKGTKMKKYGTQEVTVTGSNQFGTYESDFGWGRPVSTEVMSMYQNNEFSMSKRRDDVGGVEIGICLNKCEMDVFLPLFTSGLANNKL